jgi:hypothetical protein
VFAESAVVGAEGGEEVGVDIKFAGNSAMDEDGDDDLGFGFEGAGEIAGIGTDVVNDDGFAGGGSGTTDALIKRDAGVASDGALEVTEHEDAGVFFEHVKADPIVASEFFVKESDDGFHEGLGGGGGLGEGVEGWDEVGRFGVCDGHKR